MLLSIPDCSSVSEKIINRWKMNALAIKKVIEISDEPPVTLGRSFRYTTIACEILIFALVGWVIGPYIWGPGGEIIGAMIGAIAGTLMMFCTLFYLAGLFGRRGRQEE